MAKYKISVSLDEENPFWIVVDNGRFIRNPTEEDLKCTRSITYNLTNICPRCREEWEKDGIELTDKSILYPKNALRGFIPKFEILDMAQLKITKNPSKGVQWYEKYRVKDESTLELVNKIYHEILKKVKRFRK